MELLTILVSDYANIAEGGKVNVMGIFSDIYASSFPTIHSSMFLVIKLSPEFPEYGQQRQLTITLVDGDGKLELAKITGEIDVPMSKNGRRPEIVSIIELKGIIFPKPGRYQFSVLIDKDFKGSLAIDVEQIQQEG